LIDTSILAGLNANERAAASLILQEMRGSGTSRTLQEIANVDYARIPVGPREFFTSDYFMGTEARKRLYPTWLEELSYVCDPKNGITEWIITGPIGGGKTAAASMAVYYKAYVLSCLQNPQDYYGLMPGHRIVFGLFTIFKYKVRTTSFHYLNALIEGSPYFREHFPKNPKLTAAIEFPSNVGVVAGSKEAHQLSENIYVFVIDEANFMLTKDSAEEEGQAYELYSSGLLRMKSRFLGPRGIMPWLMVVVSSKKRESDFTARRIKQAKGNPRTHVSNFPIWKLKPAGTFPSGKFFSVQVGDCFKKSKVLGDGEKAEEGTREISVPVEYREEFEMNLEKSLADIAGEVLTGENPLITRPERIMDCLDNSRAHPCKVDVVESDFRDVVDPGDIILPQFIVRVRQSRREPRVNPGIARYMHVDIGLTGDSAGVAIGHPAGIVQVPTLLQSGEKGFREEALVYIDFMLRVVPSEEIDISFLRDLAVYFRDRLGYVFAAVTYDGFQSRGSLQELRRLNFDVDLLSVDTNQDIYARLQRAVLERRVSYYFYEPFFEELRALEVVRRKMTSGAVRVRVDHPRKNKDGTPGRKDVCDAVAAVVYQCSCGIVSAHEPPGGVEIRTAESWSGYGKVKEDLEDFSWVIPDSSPESKAYIKNVIEAERSKLR